MILIFGCALVSSFHEYKPSWRGGKMIYSGCPFIWISLKLLPTTFKLGMLSECNQYRSRIPMERLSTDPFCRSNLSIDETIIKQMLNFYLKVSFSYLELLKILSTPIYLLDFRSFKF